MDMWSSKPKSIFYNHKPESPVSISIDNFQKIQKHESAIDIFDERVFGNNRVNSNIQSRSPDTDVKIK